MDGRVSAAAQIQSCFVVGHDLGGLIALQLASRSPSIVKGVSIVSSVAAAPTGDGAENLTLAYPPVPLWSRASQRWAFEQLSYSPHHITRRIARRLRGRRAATLTSQDGGSDA